MIIPKTIQVLFIIYDNSKTIQVLFIIYDNSKTIQLAIILCDNNDLHICSFMQKRYVIYTLCIYSLAKYGIIMLSCKRYV